MNDHLPALWQQQPGEGFRMTPDEIKRRMEMSRRHSYDVYAAAVLSSTVIVALAVLGRHMLLSIGAALTVLGLAFLSRQVHRARIRNALLLETGRPASLELHRAALRRQLAFHSSTLWSRVAALTPGGILFFLGLAAAFPNLAIFIYIQLATFLVAIIATVPLNRRMAAQYQRELDELARLQSD